jgi:hypothetical protein
MDTQHIATTPLISTLIRPTGMAKRDVLTNANGTNSTKDEALQENLPQTKAPSRTTLKKYNHLFAIHSSSKVTILSTQDVEKAPSFVGFRNLMTLMLCKASVPFYRIRDLG